MLFILFFWFCGVIVNFARQAFLELHIYFSTIF